MKSIFKKLVSVSLLAVMFSACKKDLLDINVDPNNPTTASASPGIVLPAALQAAANIYNNPTADARFSFAALWLGQISYSGNYAIATENISYALTNSFAGTGVFASLYDNIEDFDFVETKGAAAGNTFYRAIGMFMKAYNYQTLVDLFNNVPYSQALQGTANSKPAYDNGQAIYDDLAKKMDTAINIFKTTAAGNPITGDIMFNGNAASWLKFANTVKLRLLLRQSEKRAAYAQTEAAKLSGASFLDVDAAMNPGYSASTGKANPLYASNINVTNNNYTQDFLRAGQYAVAFFQAHNDPRLARYFKPTAAGTFQGNYFGDQGIPNSKTSEFGPGVLKSATQPSILMLAAESYFLQAEAVLRGWIAGNAQTLYQTGVEKSFVFLGLTVAQAQAYYNQAGDKQVNWAATTTFQEKLALIIRQKWAAEILVNALEPYNDYRRLRLPADVPLSVSPFSTGIMPNRLPYPQREYDINGENALAQGNVKPSDKVWWMP
jgi:hypothetical protein